MGKIKTRRTIAATGSFGSVPSAFPSLDDGVKHALKFEFRTIFSGVDKVETEFSTDGALIDLGAVIPASLDSQKIIKDCDLIKQVASSHPNQLRQLVTALQAGTASGVEKANQIIKRIGLTEDDFINAGGGLFFLVVVVVAAVAAGGCGTLNSNKGFKSSTLPKKPK